MAGAATGRGEAQTLRLSLLYALLDGKPVIDAPHLQAAHAVWRYCKASARIIFSQEEEDPLELLLLNVIKAQPGINRKGLYKASGGHIPAATLMQALVVIRDRGLVRCETAATGGRPAERWYPCEQTSKGRGDAVPDNAGLSSFARSASAAVASSNAQPSVPQPTMPDDGNCQPRTEQEPNKSASPTIIVGNGDASPDADAAAPAKPLSLAELFHAMNEVGGRLVRQGNAVTINADGKALPAEVEAALAIHQEALAQLVPVTATEKAEPMPVLEREAEPEQMTPKQFFDLARTPEGREKSRDGERSDLLRAKTSRAERTLMPPPKRSRCGRQARGAGFARQSARRVPCERTNKGALALSQA